MTGGLEVLARGPWPAERVATTWRDEEFVLPPATARAADAELAALAERGSPSHDSTACRLAGFRVGGAGLALELQRIRWSARLAPDKHDSFAVVCAVRDADGRWLAGRRAPWIAIEPGRWMFGAAGGVAAGEDPRETMAREVREEWSLDARPATIDALVRLPDGYVWLVGTATAPAGAEPVPDDEHDAWGWWPPRPGDWPAEAWPLAREVAALAA